eukprot:TRINITY_DN4241_c0_g3_i1.p1 TRINITY_DN4241_c0_g3~~TRINITY_DN4241_c0_g3_i1.p1  ORF type:complete len:289 (+),score=73.99 TRINITY_DN4241_c0_g3_i1:254-1120(+)
MNECSVRFEKTAKEEAETGIKNANALNPGSIPKLSLEDEYTDNIYSYLREREKLAQNEMDGLNEQAEVADKFRNEMLEWMVNTQLVLKLNDEALFLAFNIVTRYLKVKKVTQYEFLLLCFASLTIASKYSKHHSPHLKSFIAATNNLLSKTEAVKMELVVLETFQFDISFPTVFDFLQRVSRYVEVNGTVFSLALYICESQAMDLAIAKHPPSLLAIAAFHLAGKSTNNLLIITDMSLAEIGYGRDQVERCAEEILSNMTFKKRRVSSIIKTKHKAIADLLQNENLFN